MGRRLDALEAFRGAWDPVVLYDAGGDAVRSLSLCAAPPLGEELSSGSAPLEDATILWVQGLDSGPDLLADGDMRQLFVMVDSESFAEGRSPTA